MTERRWSSVSLSPRSTLNIKLTRDNAVIDHMKVRLAALRKKTAVQVAPMKRDARLKSRTVSQEAVSGTSPR